MLGIILGVWASMLIFGKDHFIKFCLTHKEKMAGK